jgi:hypothetical protein
MELTFCTIVARNYLPLARALAASCAQYHPGAVVYVLVLDDVEDAVVTELPLVLVKPADLAVSREEWHQMAAIYTVLEMATAAKPWLLSHLLKETGGAIVYLDPDVQAQSRFVELEGLAPEPVVVLTPHLTTPKPRDDALGEEEALLMYGTFNLGFITVLPGAEPFLKWWQGRLRRRCLDAPSRGLFVDQRWMDMAPSFFDVRILRHPGYNVAFWNASERQVESTPEGGYRVLGNQLRFVHFSGFDPRDQERMLTRSLGMATAGLPSEMMPFRELAAAYAKEIVSYGFLKSQGTPYGYGRTRSGRPLDREARNIYREALVAAERGGRPTPPDPFSCEDEHEFEQWARRRLGPAGRTVHRARPLLGTVAHRARTRAGSIRRLIKTPRP